MKQLLGFRNFRTLPRKQPGIPLPTLPSEGDLLLERLAADGIEVPAPDQRSVDLNLTVQDEKRFTDWVSRLHSDGGRRWIGVGPGCKQPVNGWPIENYAATLSELIKRFDIWPVIFGGSEDRDAGAYLINQAGRGYNAAGKLDVRAAAAAMRHCALFVGNDTGTMHIAASAGIPCIGIYSSRQWRGLWEPYTKVRRILRTEIECEGCLLSDCVALNKECIRRITPPMVAAACAEFLEKSGNSVAVATTSSISS
jgi:heptosyltransferase-3